MADAMTKKDGESSPKRRAKAKSSADWIRDSRILLENARKDPQIAARLEGYGYDAARFAAGLALSDEVDALMLKQRTEYGQSYEATEAAAAAWRKADEAYVKALKVARIALRDRRGPRSAMMVDGPRKQSLGGWLKQAEAFYGNLLPDREALADMRRFGYSLETLQAEASMVREISAKEALARKEQGEAQGATRERDGKMDELALWISDLRAIAKIALKDSPDKLKTIGI